jgi:hypothetical protein
VVNCMARTWCAEAGAGLVGWPVEVALGDGGWQRLVETMEEGM